MKSFLSVLCLMVVIQLASGQARDALGQRARLRPQDFVFDFNSARFEVQNNGGGIRRSNVNNFASLAGEGVSWVLFNLEPCSQNMPNHHPRATEFIFVINGSNLTTGHVDENGGKVVVNRGLRAGQSTLVPKGLIHFEQNNGCGVVTYLSALNSEDPGVVTSGLRLWSLPEAAVSAAFGRPAPFFSVQASNFPGPGIANGRSNPECAARCRLRF